MLYYRHTKNIYFINDPTMKASTLLLLLPSMGPSAAGFVTNLHPEIMPPSSALLMEIPKPENWAPFKLGKFKKDEQREMNKKKQHFQSRPLVDFQKDLEAGKVRYVTPRCWPPIFSTLSCCVVISLNLSTILVYVCMESHLFPVMFAKQRVQMGELRPSDIPVSMAKRRRPFYCSLAAFSFSAYISSTDSTNNAKEVRGQTKM